MENHFDYEKFIRYFNFVGSNIICPDYKIPRDFEPEIWKMAVYFYNMEEQAAKLNIKLYKGIFLNGPVGCGKTKIMEIFRYITKDSFRMAMCRNIAFDFIESGIPIIKKYSYESRDIENIHKPITYCFDDLGAENISAHFGNKVNVMDEILSIRYDMIWQYKMKTHATSNLNSDEIEEKYGIRLKSRFSEMFNLISFNNNARDFRKEIDLTNNDPIQS